MSEDLSLRQDVERELGWEPMVQSAEIGVGVKDGIVTLSGVVANHPAKRAAERAAARVFGVKAVSSQLEVASTGSEDRGDAEIAWAAANALAWNPLIPADRIHIEVSLGWVTLEGSVEWRFQRRAAEDAIADLAGVAGVTNLISVAPAVPASEITEQVEQTIDKDCAEFARRIVVEARGDCVTLWGSVHSVQQREAAERAAWSVPGVRDVSNHITVEAHATAGA